MIGREGPGPERPGPDYPPEWDREPDEEEHDGELLAANRAAEESEPSCRSPFGCLAPGEGCPGRCPITDEELRELERAVVVTPDPWSSQGPVPPPPF